LPEELLQDAENEVRLCQPGATHYAIDLVGNELKFFDYERATDNPLEIVTNTKIVFPTGESMA
jgi:hypothetical protein